MRILKEIISLSRRFGGQSPPFSVHNILNCSSHLKIDQFRGDFVKKYTHTLNKLDSKPPQGIHQFSSMGAGRTTDFFVMRIKPYRLLSSILSSSFCNAHSPLPLSTPTRIVPMKKLHYALILLLSTSLWSLHAQDQTISGSLIVNGNQTVTGSQTVAGALTVTGVADFNHNTTNFGSNTATPTSPGIVLTYTDTTSGTVSTITFGTSGTTGIWQWERNSASGLLPQMTLSDASNSNTLTIYTATATPSAGIILNPSGTSTFTGSINSTGTNSQLPNQTLTGTGSLLTQSLGDARYLAISDANTTFVTTSQASTSYMPLSPSTLAVGYQSTASGTNAVAVGYQSLASGRYAVAMGGNATASGTNSAAIGYQTTAQGYGQFVIGQYNVLQGSATSWVTTDDLFIIGNGTSASARSNAFVVKKNGNTSINGSAVISGGTTLSSDLKVVGNTRLGGNLTISGTVRVEPQGDISMGSFTGGNPTAAQVASASYAATLAAAGVTLSATESANITQFLTGIDNIVGLDNVAEIWTLRSTQNAGTGTTAYGLLGKQNGTLINGPTWSANGMVHVSTNSTYVSLGAITSSSFSAVIFFSSANVVDDVFTCGPLDIRRYNDTQIGSFLSQVGGYNLVISTPSQAASFVSVCAYLDRTQSPTLAGLYSTATASSPTATTTSSSSLTGMYTGSNYSGYSLTGTISAAIVIGKVITRQQYIDIHTLYKTTIGQNLNLP
jgi:hypothetical protein